MFTKRLKYIEYVKMNFHPCNNFKIDDLHNITGVKITFFLCKIQFDRCKATKMNEIKNEQDKTRQNM